MILLLDPKNGAGIISNVINDKGQEASLQNPGTPSWCSQIPNKKVNASD